MIYIYIYTYLFILSFYHSSIMFSIEAGSGPVRAFPGSRGSLWLFLHTPLPEDTSSPKTVYNGATQEAAVPQFPRKWSMFRGT